MGQTQLGSRRSAGSGLQGQRSESHEGVPGGGAAGTGEPAAGALGADCRAASLMGAKGFSLRPPPTGPLRPAREAHWGGGKPVACWGCRDEVPRTGWLQRSTGLGVGGLRWRCQQGPRGRVCPQPLAATDNPRGPSACRHVTPVSAFGVTRHAPRASVSECPLPVGTLVTLEQSPPQPPRSDHVFKGPVST